MNLGKKLGYWRQHTRSITEHDDESLSVRKALIAQMRTDLDQCEIDMEQRETDRVKALMEDAGDPNEVAAAQEVLVPEQEEE